VVPVYASFTREIEVFFDLTNPLHVGQYLRIAFHEEMGELLQPAPTATFREM